MLGYGQLKRVIVFSPPSHPYFEKEKGVRLLAVIKQMQTQGSDARKTITKYQYELATLVMDVNDIIALVGRVCWQNEWYIIDRFEASAADSFEDTAEGDDEDSIDD